MQEVRRKKKRSHRKLKILIFPLLALAILAVVLFQKTETEHIQADIQKQIDAHVLKDRVLLQKDEVEVEDISVSLRGGEGWHITRQEDGSFQEDSGFQVSDRYVRLFLQDASNIACEEVFSEDTEEFRERLDEFGLSDPRADVRIRYAGGVEVHLLIGDRSAQEEKMYYYFTLDLGAGLTGLYGMDSGTAGDWMTGRMALHEVVQPNFHSARMDHIILKTGDETKEWKLDANVEDEDASDHWELLSPYLYPVDGTEMRSFLSAIGQMTLGTFEAEGTEENLTRYGFDQPRCSLYVHMAEGMTARTDSSGVVSTVMLEEETVEMKVGGQKSDLVDYVLYEGEIFLMSHLILGPVVEKDPMTTLSRYLVNVPSAYVRRLTVEEEGERRVYEILTEEQEEEATDGEESGTVRRCFLNGQEIPYETFEARYSALEVARVSGTLPEGEEVSGEEMRKIEIWDVTGRHYTITLSWFDAFHDALTIWREGEEQYDTVFYVYRTDLGL